MKKKIELMIILKNGKMKYVDFKYLVKIIYIQVENKLNFAR